MLGVIRRLPSRKPRFPHGRNYARWVSHHPRGSAAGSLAKRPVKWFCPPAGEVAERSKAHAWKVCRRETVSRVRIPLSPPGPYPAPRSRRISACSAGPTPSPVSRSVSVRPCSDVREPHPRPDLRRLDALSRRSARRPAPRARGSRARPPASAGRPPRAPPPPPARRPPGSARPARARAAPAGAPESAATPSSAW